MFPVSFPSARTSLFISPAFIQIRNWKPLTLDQISDLTNSEITIGDLFGDICSFITLRIRLCRPRMSAAHELKDKLLQVLLAHSYNLLTTNNSGSSIDQQILSSLIRGRDQQQQQQLELNEDARRRFDQWYLQQVFNQYRQFALAAQQHSVSVSGLRSGNPSPGAASTAAAAANHPLFMDINNLTNGTDSTLAAAAAGLHPSLAAAAAAAAVRPSPVNGNIVGPSSNSCSSQEKPFGHSKNSSGNHNSHSSHHHSSGTSSRTRIRTSFDPELELPKLHKWFAENRHPSRSQVQEYVKELNSLESRKGRKPLDVNNVVYWFKNARAAHKRAELKFVSNDSNLSNHSFANALATEFFLNGGGNHSPGKASSDASASGKCNDDPMSNASRNGSNLDDYYSFDEDNDSHEETQTLDLSVRNPLCMSTKLSDSPHQPIEDKMLDDGDDCDDFKFVDDLKRHDLSDVSDLRLEPDVQLKIESRDYGGSAVSGNGSDCNSIEDESDDDTETTHNNNNNCSHNNSLTSHSLTSSLSALNHNSGHSSHNPESPEGRRTRRSRTFIDPMSEVPRLESWFMSNTHPAHSQIVRYTDELNKMPYRQKFPKLEPKNIQFWFKNRRAKFKRTSGMNTVTMNLSSNSAVVTSASASNASGTSPSLSNASIHNSSALNIERLINAH
ncbi:DNA- binding [Dermatophagoides pteronyssinus]|uniref:DNA- binding n=1 Tax=Dermatophagoides pteronyssinus TaxID=6956 RepID=A0ABQ8IZS3_DERPT|nr:DNA- binding [Dermatophagoides pteronyssinus]